MNKKFIQIPNSMFIYNKVKKGTGISIIGTKGFAIWCYLVMLQGGNITVPITIESLIKQMNVQGLKDKRVVKLVLLNLKRLKYIECENLNKKTKPKELIYIKVWKYEEVNFTQISSQFILDYISKLGHIGFALYCLMFKEHNIELGNQSFTDYGYCHRTTDWFAERLNLTRKTVEKHINKIPEKLVKIEEQPPMVTYNDKGEKKYTQQPNRYYVKAKYNIEHKYYIPPKETNNKY